MVGGFAVGGLSLHGAGQCKGEVEGAFALSFVGIHGDGPFDCAGLIPGAGEGGDERFALPLVGLFELQCGALRVEGQRGEVAGDGVEGVIGYDYDSGVVDAEFAAVGIDQGAG
ncbi:hypothetical protein HUE57_05330 [Candidatus Reidiella endopervernicosa]|uniref:Uncharacterized protein n=1 Tax=Candidatus Reidiella endopervernicosa TaxID=2738883 RepID=A0A6N0HTY0_9GAMM|nr:hypothetical protein [Candidatus Reidiella endopervernicosa]QKQ25770.1 hypothetical protein HUE57_05330 [Candidatus Reidiella endopervernicosa]